MVRPPSAAAVRDDAAEYAAALGALVVQGARAGWSAFRPAFQAALQNRELEAMGGNRIGRIVYWYMGGALTEERLRTLLATWWASGEGHSTYGTGRLVAVFQAAGFVTDTAGVGPPAGELTVYRGVTAGRNRRRISWTLEPDIAAWFARRYALMDGRGAVLAAEVSPRHVLGIFHERQEAEVVVNWRGLRNIREVERVDRPSEHRPAAAATREESRP